MNDLDAPSDRRVAVAALVALAVAVLVVVAAARWMSAPFDAVADARPAYSTAPQAPATTVALTPAPLDRTELRIPQSLVLRGHSARTAS